MVMNVTALLATPLNYSTDDALMIFNQMILDPTKRVLRYEDCFNWCKSEHFAHNYDFMQLYIFILIGWAIYFIVGAMAGYADETNKAGLQKIQKAAFDFAIIFTILLGIAFILVKYQMWGFGA
jgi:aromatic ring hydroxylase